MEDIRWIQRYSNYCKAFDKLEVAVNLLKNGQSQDDDVVALLREGLIQRFEYTHELAWNVMKDYAEYQGYVDVRGSRDAMRKAFEMNLISDKRWMESIKDRNETSHNYDEQESLNIYNVIVDVYYPLFCQFKEKMDEIKAQQ